MRPVSLLRGGMLAVAVALSAPAAVLAWWRVQDPLSALPRDPPGAVSVLEEQREMWDGRVLLHVTMRGASIGDIRFVVSLPEPLPRDRIPVVMVLGGLSGASRSIREITALAGDPGPNAFIGYDWPLPAKLPPAIEMALRVAEMRRAVLSVPGQVDAVLAWASAQPWADPSRVSLLGFSLGGFVVPAAQRLAESRGAQIHSTILGYAGAPIGKVIASHPGVKPAWLARPLGATADLLLRPVEPTQHLPYLRGRFLVLRADRDRLIARSAVDRLIALTPEPRTVMTVNGDHLGLGPQRQELLQRAVASSRAWLRDQGAILPSTASP